jgi:carbamoyl-phosphate synthase/aspartate carbamoyltransferase
LIYNSVRTLASYGDLVVIRHPEIGSAQIASQSSPVPVINAGDGAGEHPTQALLDVFTIREELGTVNGLTVTLVGDLKYGRTVHSLVKILSLYKIKLIYVSPDSLKIPEQVKQYCANRGVNQRETNDLVSVIPETDVLYVTRMQKERFAPGEYEVLKDTFVVTNSMLKPAKANMIVMHPLPRNNEIDPEVDFDPRAAYFRQMRYGMFVRMAVLALLDRTRPFPK